MPGPFPGMDPFLEHGWGDVHTTLVVYAANALRPQLPPECRAWIEERLSDFDDEGVPCDGFCEPVTERTLYISVGRRGPVVTSIEFLSPHNKLTERARQQFRRKQELLLAGEVNLVEIDLVRQGGWVVSVREPASRQPYPYPYRVCVVRADRPSRAECYALSLRERLPKVRIPLRPADADVVLDLQALVDAAWRDGRYEDLDRSRESLPPFDPADTEWIKARLSAAAEGGQGAS